MKLAFFLCCLVFSAACGGRSEISNDQTREEQAVQPRANPGGNTLREFVNEPKDKARSAKRQVEGAQKRERAQAEEIAAE